MRSCNYCFCSEVNNSWDWQWSSALMQSEATRSISNGQLDRKVTAHHPNVKFCADCGVWLRKEDSASHVFASILPLISSCVSLLMEPRGKVAISQIYTPLSHFDTSGRCRLEPNVLSSICILMLGQNRYTPKLRLYTASFVNSFIFLLHSILTSLRSERPFTVQGNTTSWPTTASIFL